MKKRGGVILFRCFLIRRSDEVITHNVKSAYDCDMHFGDTRAMI